MAHEKETVVDRYSTGARINHWITAGSLILLALSGFALFHPSLFFLTALFGGGQWTRILRYNFPTGSDFRWLWRIGAVLDGDEERLPEVGRYNAGQKLYFWGMTFTIIALVTSGVVLWDQYFTTYFTIEQKRLGAVVHAVAAVAAVVLWIVHAYAAIWIKGTVRAMMRGNVTGGWAWRHHRRWLRDDVASKKRAPAE
jgi:formate dehydrogenase subunit gamma